MDGSDCGPVVGRNALRCCRAGKRRRARRRRRSSSEAKPDTAKPDADKAGAPAEEGGAPSGEASGTASLKDLVSDGFVIRTTVFIPADAVTRQLGKVASDAIVLTLQKQTSTAVCYYTFKAYVGEGLTTIPSCIVHR